MITLERDQTFRLRGKTGAHPLRSVPPMSMITTAEIMRIAELRDGLVTRDQLRKHGLSGPQVSRLVFAEVLRPVFRGVYAVSPPPWPLALRALAACLASPTVVVSDMTAAAHWTLRRTPRDVLEVVVPAPQLPRLRNVRIHRTNRLDERDIVGYANGLRVTSPRPRSVPPRSPMSTIVFIQMNKSSDPLHPSRACDSLLAADQPLRRRGSSCPREKARDSIKTRDDHRPAQPLPPQVVRGRCHDAWAKESAICSSAAAF